MFLSSQVLQVSQMVIAVLPAPSALYVCKYFFHALPTVASTFDFAILLLQFTDDNSKATSSLNLQRLADLAVLAETGFMHTFQQLPGSLSTAMHYVFLFKSDTYGIMDPLVSTWSKLHYTLCTGGCQL